MPRVTHHLVPFHEEDVIVALAAECLGALCVTCSASPGSGSGLCECVFQGSAS